MTTAPVHRFRTVTRDGTVSILLGTIVASLGAYVFQVIGGRALGPVEFAPVTALLTIHFLVFTVLLMPIEQYVVRRVTLDEGSFAAARGPEVYWVAAGSVALAAVFSAATVDRFFAGELSYALIGGVAVAANFLMAMGRGHLAGVRRFRSYGQVSGSVAVFRVAIAVAIMPFVIAGPVFGWALALAPLIVLAWRPFTVPERLMVDGLPPAPKGPNESAGKFLAGFILANAASQVLLLSAPLIVGALEDAPALVSVVFVTYQLFRAPIVMAQNLLARILPPFTTLAAGGFHSQLKRWALRISVGGVAIAAVGAAAGYALGPAIVALLFGEEFRPDPMMAALAAAGMVIAAASLFASQILVARAQTTLLAAAWVVGFLGAGVGIALAGGGPDIRVSVGFVVGEAAALLAIVGAAVGARRPLSI